MSAFVSASRSALVEQPVVNGYIDDETQEIVYRNSVDISGTKDQNFIRDTHLFIFFKFSIAFIVAVASPTGLVVPVLRNTEKMTFADIEKTIALFGNKAKNGTLALEEMTGEKMIRLQVYTDF